MVESKYVVSLGGLSRADLQRCGGKAAGLGELIRLGYDVPPGFCIVGDALAAVVGANGLGERIAQLAASLNFDEYHEVERTTGVIRSLIESANIPGGMESEVREGHSDLVSGNDNRQSSKYVAVRSSVAVKNSDISSFPGMMDTFHYVLGWSQVLQKVKECWASLWTVRAAHARHRRQIAHENAIIAPIVQRMAHSEVAGVLLTANPVTRSTSEIVIESNWELGESVVSGKSVSDFFVVDKTTFAVKERRIPRKTLMVTLDERGAGRADRPVPPHRSAEATLSNAHLVALAHAGRRLEDHFGFNVDVEWAFEDGALYLLQVRRILGFASLPKPEHTGGVAWASEP